MAPISATGPIHTRGQIEAEISKGIIRFERERMGRGPADIRTQIAQDMVIVLMADLLTPAEHALIRAGGVDLLKQVRMTLLENEREMLNTLLRGATGCQVASEIIRAANQAATRLLRGAPEALWGQPLARFVPAQEQSRFAAYCTRLRLGQEARRDGWEVTLQPLEGPPFPAALTASPLSDPTGRGLAWSWAIRDITRQRRAAAEREQLLQDLQRAQRSLTTLSRLVPICAVCKRIRTDAGTWNELTAYLAVHFDFQVSHRLCPDCRQRLYPEVIEDEVSVQETEGGLQLSLPL